MTEPKKKGGKIPARTPELTPAQKAARTRAEKQALDKADAQRLAQIVNLIIAGHDIADIAAASGATPDEIERMLLNDMARFVRTQPALRRYVRNFISAKYTLLLNAVYDEATDKGNAKQLEYFDRAVKVLQQMERLHGAAAPQQSEVKIESAPEAVERLVEVLSTQQGLAYNTDIFDVVDAELVEDANEQANDALEASEADEMEDEDDG